MNVFKRCCQSLLIAIAICAATFANAKTDLVFIVDGSGSINSSDWNIQRQGIVAAIQDTLVVPRDGSVSIAVVQFASSTRLEFPYRLIDSEADAQAAISAVQSMSQFSGSTGPGNGINTATSHLISMGALEDDFQSYCLSTDGNRNTGATVPSAISNAQSANFSLDRFSVIAIEDPPFFDESDAINNYEPHVFGGGAVFVVTSFTEFAGFVGSLCMGEPLKLVGMEVTQVVQDLDNKVMLIEEKKTLVRTYIEPKDGTDPVKATARLKGTRGGVDLPGSPLTASNSGGSIVAKPDALSRRDILSDSLNFQLPDSWLSGTVELELEAVGGTLECMESAGPTANDCMSTVTFNQGSELEVKFVKVKYEKSGSTIQPSNADLNELEQRLLATFPTSKIDRTTGTLDMGASGDPKVDDVLSRLESMRFLDFCWDLYGCERLYYGAVDQTGSLLTASGSGTGGKANGIPGSVSAGVIRDGNSYGRNRHGHEIAHTMGRHHASNAALVGTQVFGTQTYEKGACGSFAEASAPNFPNIFNVSGAQRATIGPMSSGDNKLVYGWDSQRNSVVDPNKTFAMMSYCSGFRWPSDFSYEGIRSYINTNFSTASLIAPSPIAVKSFSTKVASFTQWKLIRGIIDLDNYSIQFLPALPFELPAGVIPPNQDGTDYILEVKDSSGNIIDSVLFTPAMLEGDGETGGGSGQPDDGTALMLVPIMSSLDISTITVRRVTNNDVVGTQTASENAPVVEVTFPNGGEILNPPDVDIVWTSSDDDPSDVLTHTVQFSPDSGTTWETLVTDFSGNTLNVSLFDLGQTTQGLVRVIASDGFLSDTDESDGIFTTPNTTPSCQITSPVNGASFVGVQPINLSVFTHDTEEGTVSNIQWSSNLDGNLGNGETIQTELGTGINASGIRRLREGTHIITMNCTDGGGLSAQDTISISVSLIQQQIKGDADNDGDVDRNDILLLRQDLGKPTDGSSCGAKCDMNDDGVINALDLRFCTLACTRSACAVN